MQVRIWRKGGALAYFLQITANGLHNGALYALLAYGYVLTYSVTKAGQPSPMARSSPFPARSSCLVQL